MSKIENNTPEFGHTEQKEWVMENLWKAKFTQIPSPLIPMAICSKLKYNELRVLLFIGSVAMQQTHVKRAYVTQTEISNFTGIHAGEVSLSIASLTEKAVIYASKDERAKDYYAINEEFDLWKADVNLDELEMFIFIRNEHATKNAYNSRKKKWQQRFVN